MTLILGRMTQFSSLLSHVYVVAARSTGAPCLPALPPWSTTPEEGASLRFELEESERLCK